MHRICWDQYFLLVCFYVENAWGYFFPPMGVHSLPCKVEVGALKSAFEGKKSIC